MYPLAMEAASGRANAPELGGYQPAPATPIKVQSGSLPITSKCTTGRVMTKLHSAARRSRRSTGVALIQHQDRAGSPNSSVDPSSAAGTCTRGAPSGACSTADLRLALAAFAGATAV